VTVELFPFRHRDAVTGKWIHARYKATLAEMQQRHDEWEITGPPEYRDGDATMFRPFRFLTFAELQQIREHAPIPSPEIDPDEAALSKLFLGRYVTWCARARHLDRIPGAVALYRSLG
jgi:hypothetical protein